MFKKKENKFFMYIIFCLHVCLQARREVPDLITDLQPIFLLSCLLVIKFIYANISKCFYFSVITYKIIGVFYILHAAFEISLLCFSIYTPDFNQNYLVCGGEGYCSEVQYLHSILVPEALGLRPSVTRKKGKYLSYCQSS